MAVEQQHGFSADDELTEAARLHIRLQRISPGGVIGFPPDDELTEAASLRITLQTIRLDERAKHRRGTSPLRLIASLAGLIRYLLSKLRL
ncbi:MAG TPA: hypothetical protein VFJ07_05825 [Streptosporangiaceae bacterium]|nr:hypothetical protein [Streptosporangiaceae bacterium]